MPPSLPDHLTASRYSYHTTATAHRSPSLTPVLPVSAGHRLQVRPGGGEGRLLHRLRHQHRPGRCQQRGHRRAPVRRLHDGQQHRPPQRRELERCARRELAGFGPLGFAGDQVTRDSRDSGIPRLTASHSRTASWNAKRVLNVPPRASFD